MTGSQRARAKELKPECLTARVRNPADCGGLKPILSTQRHKIQGYLQVFFAAFDGEKRGDGEDPSRSVRGYRPAPRFPSQRMESRIISLVVCTLPYLFLALTIHTKGTRHTSSRIILVISVMMAKVKGGTP